MSKMKCHVRIEITHSKRGVMQGCTTHSALETLRLHLRVTNIAIRCKTLHNPTLVVCYFYNSGPVVHVNTCKTATCRYCPQLNTSGHITGSFTNRSYSTKTRVDCKSKNLIYCITCKTCKIQYLGPYHYHLGTQMLSLSEFIPLHRYHRNPIQNHSHYLYLKCQSRALWPRCLYWPY